ncbi:MAG TPA: L,D-transpeptidase family protein [Puia sp.]|nr:L,D-transpeptidase family protein [Puia sp.]
MTKICFIKKSGLLAFVLLLPIAALFAQASSYSVNFLDYQRSIPKIGDVMKRKEDTLIKQFQAKGLTWPAKFVYIRSFKYDCELELWVKNKSTDKYKLFKTYKICALAGSLGPKRMAGDYQVPEGFYYINEFNPRSLYHLSLGLNYPNESDRLLSDISQPGGDIYIHGSCVTTGCIPITDEQIEELYILAAHAKDLGQDFIPVHIFPVDFRSPRSVTYLNRYLQTFAENGSFERSMKNAFYYFEKNHQVPLVIVNGRGEYVTEDAGPVVDIPKKPESKPVKKNTHAVQPIPEEELAKVVDRQPIFPGGNEAFKNFIDSLGKDMINDLEPGQRKTYVMVEYIIDKTGKPVYANVISGGNDKMNEDIEQTFLKMPGWLPAMRSGMNVPIKLKQTIIVESGE